MTAPAGQKYCTTCGELIHEKAEICPHCGVRQPQKASAGSTKDKTTAGILGIFLGGIGLHKFYLGQTGMGIVYFLACWTFIPAIIGFVEGIVILSMSDDKFNEKYNA